MNIWSKNCISAALEMVMVQPTTNVENTPKMFPACRGEVINGGFGLLLDGTEVYE